MPVDGPDEVGPERVIGAGCPFGGTGGLRWSGPGAGDAPDAVAWERIDGVTEGAEGRFGLGGICCTGCLAVPRSALAGDATAGASRLSLVPKGSPPRSHHASRPRREVRSASFVGELAFGAIPASSSEPTRGFHHEDRATGSAAPLRVAPPLPCLTPPTHTRPCKSARRATRGGAVSPVAEHDWRTLVRPATTGSGNASSSANKGEAWGRSKSDLRNSSASSVR